MAESPAHEAQGTPSQHGETAKRPPRWEGLPDPRSKGAWGWRQAAWAGGSWLERGGPPSRPGATPRWDPNLDRQAEARPQRACDARSSAWGGMNQIILGAAIQREKRPRASLKLWTSVTLTGVVCCRSQSVFCYVQLCLFLYLQEVRVSFYLSIFEDSDYFLAHLCSLDHKSTM